LLLFLHVPFHQYYLRNGVHILRYFPPSGLLPEQSPQENLATDGITHRLNDVALTVLFSCAERIVRARQWELGTQEDGDLRWHEHLDGPSRAHWPAQLHKDHHFWLQQNPAKKSKWAKLAREGHAMAWKFAGPKGAYTGRLLIDGEIYTTSEATKKFRGTHFALHIHERIGRVKCPEIFWLLASGRNDVL